MYDMDPKTCLEMPWWKTMGTKGRPGKKHCNPTLVLAALTIMGTYVMSGE
jgi:hypothetical protein